MFYFIRWNVLSEIGRSALVRGAYIWLVITPVVARMLSAVDEPLELGKGIKISLVLPFSWKMLYFSAVAFSLGGLVYLISCPLLVKRANSYAEFKNRMYDRDVLAGWIESRRYDLKDAAAQYIYTNRKTLPESDLFWRIYGHELTEKFIARVLCALMYAVGFALLLFVFAQNLFFVADKVEYLHRWLRSPAVEPWLLRLNLL